MKTIFLLDADETLLDFRRGEKEQLSRALKAFGIRAEENILARFHEINDGLWKKLERGETTRAELVVDRFRLLFCEFHIEADPKEVSRKYFACMKEAAYLFDGAAEFIKTLKTKGRVYIVTNGSREVQRSRFALSGLDRLADGVFISEDVGCDKPSPRFAEYVEAHIPGYSRDRAVWVGDSLSSDYGCAKSKGIDFILFGKPQAGYCGKTASDYGEVLKILSQFA